MDKEIIMIKMKDLLKKEGIKLGKVYTDKDNPPFKVEGKLTEGKNAKLISNLKNDIGKLDKLVKSKKPTDSFLKKDMIVLTKAANKIFDRIETFKYFTEGKLNEKEVKISDLWKEYVKKYGKDKAAEKLMDILTAGTWAAWDGDKIKNFKKKLIKKFSKYMKEGKLTEMLPINTHKVRKAYDSVLKHMRKEVKKLNDDEMYEVTTQLKRWFNKNIM